MNYISRMRRPPPRISVADIVSGNRRALAKAITLAESSVPSPQLSALLHEIHNMNLSGSAQGGGGGTSSNVNNISDTTKRELAADAIKAAAASVSGVDNNNNNIATSASGELKLNLDAINNSSEHSRHNSTNTNTTTDTDTSNNTETINSSNSNSNTSAGSPRTRVFRRIPRIALSGSPGAGKSSLLEALGYYLCETLGLRVGVLAVDPSSAVTHGSILGDKTRMEKLSTHPNAYIRPSPSGGHLGGVTARAWEVMEVMECAGFDVIFVETVGVGQSEVQCKDLTDMMVLLVPPASGDELQGIKKGIVEVADMVVVTKNDGARTLLAQQTKAAYTRAVMYTEIEQGFAKPVMAVSAEQNKNIPQLWEEMLKMWNHREESGAVRRLRHTQSAKHFLNYFEIELVSRARRMAAGEINKYGEKVLKYEMTPRDAGDQLLRRCLRESLLPEESKKD